MLIFMSALYHLSFYFFFSSRRRHTRSLRDWSSDVCSSDLPLADAPALRLRHLQSLAACPAGVSEIRRSPRQEALLPFADGDRLDQRRQQGEIGRASCREKVWISVVGGSLMKKKLNYSGAYT